MWNRKKWVGITGIVLVIIIGVIIWYLTAKHPDSEWGWLVRSGRTLTYEFVYEHPHAGRINGELIEKGTGKTREFNGKIYTEIGYEWKNIPLPSGTYYMQSEDAGVDVLSEVLLNDREQRVMSTTRWLEFPAEIGKTWHYSSDSDDAIARISRVSDYRDYSGKIWKDCVCVSIYRGARFVGEMWLNKDVGMVGQRLELESLGRSERILKSVKNK